MNRVRVGLASFGLLLSVIAFAACGGPTGGATTVTVPPVVTAAPPVTASPTASANAVDLRDPGNVTASSWTDDEAIQALAADCNWDPGDCLKAIEAAAMVSSDGIQFAQDGAPADPQHGAPAAICQGLVPLACAQVPGQSCAPDSCSQNDYSCVPACDKSCSGCAAKCVTGCESCKSTCKDEACRLTCAKSCGECRQSCVQALDQCATSHCAEEQETCFRERNDQWTKSTCPKVCPKVSACVEKCPEIPDDYSGKVYYSDCAKACMKKLGKGCPESFDRICAGDPNAGVNFFGWRSAHEDEIKK